MRAVPFLLVGLCSGINIPTMAFAKSETKEAQVRRIIFDYAKCVVRSRHDKAAEVILSNFDNSIITHDYSSLIDGDCLGKVAGSVSLKFPADLYRYALADALVNMDFATREVESFENRLPLAHPAMPASMERDTLIAATKSKTKKAEIAQKFQNEMTIAWLSRYGECIVRQEPKNVRYWLLTVPNIPEEVSRIDALRPAFAACLDNGTLKFNRITLRGTVALNYYRLAMATPQPKTESIH